MKLTPKNLASFLGTIITYELQNGSQFKIDFSMYKGTLNTVFEEFNELIEGK